MVFSTVQRAEAIVPVDGMSSTYAHIIYGVVLKCYLTKSLLIARVFSWHFKGSISFHFHI